MPGEVELWLERIGLAQYGPAFVEADVDMSVLADLTEADLRRLGVSLGHGKKLLKAIAVLESEPAAAAPERPEAPSMEEQPAPLPRDGAERRHLTVMFCDLVGSTALSEALDLEAYREVLAAYQSRAASVVRRYDGYVARYMGDGLLVYFGYPQAHEDDAERAVKAGLRIVESVRAMGPELPVALEVRIGIASGNVVAGDIVGEGASEERAVLGETPNLAARLQALAAPGSVLIAASTRRLTGGLFAYVSAGEQILKGFTQPVEVWRVTGEAAPGSRFDATRSPEGTALVGRDSEMLLMLARWGNAIDAEGQVVVLSGEPGIGKSRLVHELKARIGTQADEALQFQCSPHYVNTAYYPFVEHVMAAAGITPGAGTPAGLDRIERWLEGVKGDDGEAAPLLAALLSIPAAERFAPLRLSPQRQKEKTIELLCSCVLERTAAAPRLVVFEDVQWADPTSLDVLSVLIDALAKKTAMLLVTHRPEFVSPWRGRGHLTTLSLARLGRRQVAQMVSDVNRRQGGLELPAALLGEIAERTDGVPLFVEELTKAFVEARPHGEQAAQDAPAGAWRPPAIPSSLQDLLVARLDRLAEVKDVAQVASAIGREFSYELLEGLSQLPAATLARALDRLEAADVIQRHGSGREARYTFKHALVQDAAYASLLKRPREQLHARLAALLETSFPDTVAREPELLAHHLTSAGLAARAVSYWQRAAGLAVERSAYREALAHLEAALRLLDTLPRGDRDRSQELELQIARAGALLPTLGYRSPETEAAFSRASELAAEVGDDRRSFAALRGLHGVLFSRAQIGEALALAQACLAIAERGTEVQPLSVAHRLVGQTLYMRGALDDAVGHLEQARALDAGRGASDVAPLVHGGGYRLMVPAFLGQVLWLRGQADQALSMASGALDEAERQYGAFTVTASMFFLCWIHGWRGEYGAVNELAGRIRRLAGEHEMTEWVSPGSLLADWQVLATGEPDEAAALARARLDAVRSQSGIMTPFKLSVLAAALGSDSAVQARDVIDEAIALAGTTGERWCEAELLRVRAELLRGTGDGTAAESCLEESLATARAQGARAFELRCATDLARLWRDGGRPEDARSLLAPLLAAFGEGDETADCRRASDLLASLPA